MLVSQACLVMLVSQACLVVLDSLLGSTDAAESRQHESCLHE